MNQNFTLLPFQVDTVDFIFKHRYCIVALDPGMGKTLCSLVASDKVNAKRTLIVCPSYLKINWKREIKKFFPDKAVVVFDSDKYFCYPFDVDFVIISYSFLKQAKQLFKWSQVLIVDEAQQLKNMSTIRGDSAHENIFEASIPRVMLLSGTIIENRVPELHSPLTIMHYNPKETDTKFLDDYPTYIEFAEEFSNKREHSIVDARGRPRKIVKWEGVKNRDKLRSILRKFTIVKRFKDHIKIKEPLNIDIFSSDIDDPELLKDFEVFLLTDGDKVSSRSKKNSAVSKVKITSQYVKEALSGKVVVVFTCHIESAKELAKNLGCPYIYGEMPVTKRQDYADKLNNGQLDLLVATVGSFSTGINLHHRCADLVLNDYPWKPSDLDQVYGRIIRIGQENQCTFHNIYASPQDEYIANTIKEKTKIIKSVMED